MVRPVLIGIAAAAGLFATPAMAQYRDGQPAQAGEPGTVYRDGQPMVMTPPPPPPDPSIGVTSRFRAAYARANAPRIVVFWNREFTDEVASKYEDYTNVRTRTNVAGQSSGAAIGGFGFGASASQGSVSSDSTTEIRSGVDRITDNRREGAYNEAVDFDIESAFEGALTGAGARLIDRTSIMRTTGLAQGAGERSNIQRLETSAILGKADIVIEIVQLADSRKADGVAYRVIGRNVRSGKIVASLSTGARPPARHMPLVAGPSGFVRAVAPEPGPSDIGRQLAIETMAALSARL